MQNMDDADPGDDMMPDPDPNPDPEPQPDLQQTIGALGGVIEYPDGRLRLSIPEGALAEDTEITVRELADEELEPPLAGATLEKVYRLGPDGLQFALPVTVTLQLPGSSEPAPGESNVAVFANFSASADSEVPAGQLVQINDDGLLLSGEINHFSDVLVVRVPGLSFTLDVNPASQTVGQTFEARASLVTTADFFGSLELDDVVIVESSPSSPSTTSLPAQPILIPGLSNLFIDPDETNSGQLEITCNEAGQASLIVQTNLATLFAQFLNELDLLDGGGFEDVRLTTTAKVECLLPAPSPEELSLAVAIQQFTINHLINGTVCPTAGPPIQVTNSGDTSVDLSVDEDLPFLTVSGCDGQSLLPGDSATCQPAFPCGGFQQGANSGSFSIGCSDPLSGSSCDEILIDATVNVCSATQSDCPFDQADFEEVP
ncbi:MAG: hypothetical protein ACPGZP_04370 [Panacagrimonas sp.]